MAQIKEGKLLINPIDEIKELDSSEINDENIKIKENPSIDPSTIGLESNNGDLNYKNDTNNDNINENSEDNKRKDEKNDNLYDYNETNISPDDISTENKCSQFSLIQIICITFFLYLLQYVSIFDNNLAIFIIILILIL